MEPNPARRRGSLTTRLTTSVIATAAPYASAKASGGRRQPPARIYRDACPETQHLLHGKQSAAGFAMRPSPCKQAETGGEGWRADTGGSTRFPVGSGNESVLGGAEATARASSSRGRRERPAGGV